MSLVCGKCHKSVEDHAHKDDQCSCISLFEENNTPMKEKDKVVTAEEILKRRGHYYLMPRPYSNENVIEAMEEYASLRVKEELDNKIKEVIQELNSYWRFDDNQKPMSSWHEKQDFIEIIKKI